MKVSEIVVRDIASCRADDSLAEAARIMWDRDCGVVPVTDEEGSLCGIITDRDICMAALLQGLPLSQVSVQQSMSRDVHACGPDDDVNSVHALMRESQIRRVPVVDENRLVGIVSLNDLAMRAVSGGRNATPSARLQVAETLAAICRHRAAAIT